MRRIEIVLDEDTYNKLRYIADVLGVNIEELLQGLIKVSVDLVLDGLREAQQLQVLRAFSS